LAAALAHLQWAEDPEVHSCLGRPYHGRRPGFYARVRAMPRPARGRSARNRLGAARQNPVRPREVAGGPGRGPPEVVLVVGRGPPERPRGSDLGDDPARPQAGRLDVGDRVLGDSPLLVVDVEDRGAIAHPDVVALTVERRRVVDLEEELEQVAVGDLL